ncbi:hypothetical protein NUW58_g5847 [Xylaria curta]|uniref:Uncharacterized protein n=1 Tax=Xylaria curta TaxID=42375 RepID=A0ACC1P148_9PEZI|nr:hypothetical protein NUW58_g5847 [Xylaria curta]
MSSFASPSRYLGGAIEPVTDGITSETVSQQPHIDGVAKIIISIIISVFIAAVAIYFSYLWIRRRSNQIRLDDTAEGLDDGPIPLVDLPPLPGSPGASPYISSNPDFSTTELPNPRPLNDRTMGLSSHPPSMTDLATAREASSSKVGAQEDMTVSLAGPPSWPSIVFQDNQEQTSLRPPCQSTPRPDGADDSQRHNMVIEFDNDSSGSASDETIQARSDLPPLPPAGPGIETMPEVLRGYDQGHTAPNFELLVPSTIKEESIPSISKGPGAERNVGLAGNDSGFGPMTTNLQVPEAQFHKEQDAGPLGQPHTASQSSHDGNDKGPMQGREMRIDDDDEYDKPSSQIANPHPPFEGVVYGSRDNQQFLNRDEEYDPRDPRYDVRNAVRRFGKKDKGPFKPDSAQVTRPLSNDNEFQPPPTAKGTEGQYACLSRDYTNASMVPAPLNLLVQRNNTIHETSPSAAAISHHFFRRPSSGARVDIGS